MAEYICPHCGQPIDDDEALLCLYCGESLGRSVGFIGGLRYAKPKAIILALVFLILFSFIVLLLL